MKTRVHLLPGLLALALLAAAAGPDTPVADAAREGALAEVRTLLRQGADVNAAHGDGMTALHWAAYRGDLEMVDVLVYAGANLEATTRVAGYTPLLVAARSGHSAAAVRLLDAGADPRARTSTGVTALHFAAGTGGVEAVEALIVAGAAVDAREHAHGQTPLVFAAHDGRVEAIRALVAAGADLDATTRVTPISRLEEEDRIESRLRSARRDAEEALRTAETDARLEIAALSAPRAREGGGADSTASADSTAAASPEGREGEEVEEGEEEEKKNEEEEKEKKDDEPLLPRLG
ncbi:MAG: ankyrin repeat domain-containing protein, partial [Longimicrobiales bacterium]|nr:ankyrin repeat domain-containing protein [Longimicrobiales bacterium]